MHKRAQNILLILFLLTLGSATSYAQSSIGDDEIVDLKGDTSVNKILIQDTLIEVISKNADGKVVDRQQKVLKEGVIEKNKATPGLDLSLLKKDATSKKDTIITDKEIKEIATSTKKTAQDKRNEILAKQKADREKVLAKLEAEKKKRAQAKALRDAKNAALESERAEKEAAKKERLARLKEEQKSAKEKAKALAKKKKEEKKRKKNESQALKDKLTADEKEKDVLTDQQKKKNNAKEAVLNKSVQETNELPTPPVKVAELITPQMSKNKERFPETPAGVKQVDNSYGTVRLAYDELATSFLLTIPTETKMHYHANHSEHIMLVEGQGMVLIGYKTVELRPNELIFVTKGTPHKIINKGKSKLKVLSIQSPFYAGKDIVILE